MSIHRARRGTTLVEAIMAMTVLSMLLVPMLALFKTSHLLWRKYESGHGGVSQRQEIAFEVNRILANAHRLTSISDSEIQFLDAAGDKHSLYGNSGNLIWERSNAREEVLADGMGTIRFRVIEKAGEALGELIEVSISCRTDAAMAHNASVFRIWIDPGI